MYVYIYIYIYVICTNLPISSNPAIHTIEIAAIPIESISVLTRDDVSSVIGSKRKAHEVDANGSKQSNVKGRKVGVIYFMQFYNTIQNIFRSVMDGGNVNGITRVYEVNVFYSM
jgi:hypothetical protein